MGLKSLFGNLSSAEGDKASTSRLLVTLLCTLSILLEAGCDSNGPQGSVAISTVAPLHPTYPSAPTPTVDIVHARNAFETGGELTYDEVRAIRHDILGDPLDPNDLQSKGKYDKDPDEYVRRAKEFGLKLNKCSLSEAVGWIAFWVPDYTENYESIPNANRLAVYMYDPYSKPGIYRNEDQLTQPELLITGVTDAQVSNLKYGERIQFSGDLVWIKQVPQAAVKNAKVQVLEDEPAIATPILDDLKDLQITLDSTFWDTAITISSDGFSGKVVWEQKNSKDAQPAATATLTKDQLVELLSEFNKADFFNLNDSYRSDASDSPTYTVSIHIHGESKRVQSHATRPRRLNILIFRIVQIASAGQLVGGK